MKTTRIALSDLVFNADIYPRGGVDPVHVSALVKALRAGAELPPIIACRETRAIIEGVHRWHAYRRVLGDDGRMDVELRDYATDAERFADAVRINARHGRRLTAYDQVHCIAVAERLEVAPDVLASAMCLRAEDVGALRTERMGILHVRGQPAEPVPLKHGARHLAGRVLRKRQLAGLKKLGGMSVSYHLHQLINALESDLIDMTNDRTLALLVRVRVLLDEKCGALKE